MAEPMIKLEHVSKTFPGSDQPAVADLSLEVERGEVVVLIGPSGCGKTTTLKMINRIIEPSSGAIWVDGRSALDVEPHELRRSIGYVIQQIGLFPHRTIGQNIATVPRLLGWEEDRISGRIEELVSLVGLTPDLIGRYPAELSGGQQQRVGVARALAADPPVLLMDEPFGAVDPIVRARLQQELRALQERLRKTIVFVTHDIDEAITLGDRIALLNVGGILEQFGSPQEILRDPENEFVAEFLGSDRGLKRLSLIPVRSVELDRGPVVGPSSEAAEARSVMAAYGVTWFAVADGERMLGWAPGETLGEGDGIDLDALRPFRSRLSIDGSLKEALDVVVSSHERVAAVFDGDRFLGMLTADAIGEEVTR